MVALDIDCPGNGARNSAAPLSPLDRKIEGAARIGRYMVPHPVPAPSGGARVRPARIGLVPGYRASPMRVFMRGAASLPITDDFRLRGYDMPMMMPMLWCGAGERRKGK